MRFGQKWNKQLNYSHYYNQESTISQYEKLKSIYQSNLEFLFNLVLESISRISNYQKHEKEEKHSIILKRREMPMIEDQQEEIEKTPLSISSLEYQFESFDKQLHSLQSIIDDQKHEIEVRIKLLLLSDVKITNSTTTSAIRFFS